MTTAVSGTPTPAQQAGQILHGLISQWGGDVLQDAEGLLGTFFANLKMTPTPTNLIAQGLALAATAPLQLPELESQAIGQFAQAGLLLTSLIPTAATSAASG